MINATRKRVNQKQTVTVWSEQKRNGGFVIYAGVRGTEMKTYAGSAMSRSTLEYNIRKAKLKFGISL
tara:strand:- start:111 stop:311 length:201 start_codon:yes stop_codon:yes gene_type:complete